MHDYGSMGCDENGDSKPLTTAQRAGTLALYFAVLAMFFGGIWAITH